MNLRVECNQARLCDDTHGASLLRRQIFVSLLPRLHPEPEEFRPPTPPTRQRQRHGSDSQGELRSALFFASCQDALSSGHGPHGCGACSAMASPKKKQKKAGHVINSRPYSWPFDRDLRPENTVSARDFLSAPRRSLTDRSGRASGVPRDRHADRLLRQGRLRGPDGLRPLPHACPDR